MTLQFNIANALSGASTVALKYVLRRPAGNFPGKIALYADHNLLDDLTFKLEQGSIIFVGTNGKTTCTLLCADMLQAAGFSVICNRTGANLDSGVATALLQSGVADWGVFEVDEMWLARVLPGLQSTYVVLLNLFPDQVDRMSIADIQARIVHALQASPNSTLIYNADDPHCAAVAASVDNPTIALGTLVDFYPEDLGADLAPQPCPKCGDSLVYTMRQYDQLGSYTCTHCNFARPDLDVVLGDVVVADGSLSFSITAGPAALRCAPAHQGIAAQHSSVTRSFDPQGFEIARTDAWTLSAPTTAKYFAYNAGFVCVVAQRLSVSQTVAQRIITGFNPQNGRLQHLSIAGRDTLVNLAKNPAGFNQNIRLIRETALPVAAAFFVNNKEGDGRSVAWLEDVDFESLHDIENLTVFAGGMCAEALLSRLVRAGFQGILVQDAKDVFDNLATADPATKVFLIANYTALPQVRKDAMRLSETHEV